jgi:hypothetical protein
MGIRKLLRGVFARSGKSRNTDEWGRPAADPAALSIAPADGYQYRDDHPWTGEDQHRLVEWLDKMAQDLDAQKPKPRIPKI